MCNGFVMFGSRSCEEFSFFSVSEVIYIYITSGVHYFSNSSTTRRQLFLTYIHTYTYIYISGGPLSALTCCVNVRLLSGDKKISPLIYSQSWVGSWVYTTQAMMTFTLIF